MSGWIKLHRQISSSTLWLSEPFTRGQAWVDLIMLANHADGWVRVNGMKVTIKRGQLAWSEGKLGERWQWSRGKVRRFLCELETEQQIVQQKTRRNPLKTIVNYEIYQGDGTTDSTSGGTSNEPQKDFKQDNNKNVKKNNNEKKEVIVIENRFDDFWIQYPRQRRGNKSKAQSAYCRALKENRGSETDIIEGVMKYGQSKEVSDGYAKGAEAWLNDDRWTTDYNINPKPGGDRQEPPSVITALRKARIRREEFGGSDNLTDGYRANSGECGGTLRTIIEANGSEQD